MTASAQDLKKDMNHDVKLSLATLDALPDTAASPGLSTAPTLKAGIVHFGVGNFHRAHQAVYLDDLFNPGRDHDWALVGAGVLRRREDGAAKARGAGLADHRRRAGQRSHRSARVTGADDRLPAARRRRRASSPSSPTRRSASSR